MHLVGPKILPYQRSKESCRVVFSSLFGLVRKFAHTNLCSMVEFAQLGINRIACASRFFDSKHPNNKLTILLTFE